MRLVEYRRVSSKGQAEDGFGLVVQRRLNRAWAKTHGHQIVKVCSDDGVSGTVPIADRPGFQCVLDALTEGKADGLLMTKLDRLARQVTVQELALAALWEQGFTVFAADTGEIPKDDPEDPMRTAMRQMIGVFAELDRRMVVKRLRDGRKAKEASGKKATGIYAYGYRAGGKGRDRDAVPNGSEQEAVKRIMALRAEGKSYREIVTALEAEGLHPRKAGRWSPMTVRNIWLRESSR
jgi:DNA invertase Pin-like site-specific DNA recombinase